MSLDQNEIEDTKSERLFKVVAITVLIIVILAIPVLLVTYFTNFPGSFGDNNAFGTFGDFIGGTLNPILTFSTVILLLTSIHLQLKELKEAKGELKKGNQTQQDLVDGQHNANMIQIGSKLMSDHLQIINNKMGVSVIYTRSAITPTKSTKSTKSNVTQKKIFTYNTFSSAEQFRYAFQTSDVEGAQQIKDDMDYISQLLIQMFNICNELKRLDSEKFVYLNHLVIAVNYAQRLTTIFRETLQESEINSLEILIIDAKKSLNP